MKVIPEHDGASAQLCVKEALEHPTSDGGVAIQTVAARHARLLLLTNIWRRPSWWLQSLRKRTIIEWYAVQMYARLIRRCGLSSPQPGDASASLCEPIRLDERAIPVNTSQETEDQPLARILYLASFLHELYVAGYLSEYVLAHAERWNRRIVAEHSCLDEPQSNVIV
jgi:hypothetical protein